MVDIRLYDYQEEMRRRIGAAFRSHRSVMVQMPTGTGKTYLLASCVYGWMERHEGEVWIVAHRRELVEQIRETVGRLMRIDVSGAGRPLSQLRVVSIQWLARHYMELEGKPSLIVVDEAHHAVAKTYSEVMNAFPKAKKLGVTATPCRLRKGGFTDLFDVLLMSWSVKRFIADGRLSLYDYMSIKADSEDQHRVFGLTKRGTDGDFSLKEMSEKLDVRPSIERLCDTVLRYAADKKGITYAIDIAHAEHIAEEYRQHGIKAVAISSRTPADERKDIIGRFKGTVPQRPETSATDIQVLVNVDLFGEGFDCPDVEFIQLARPTLSLAKYLQQVGRGMRVHDGKKYCLILDNVGLYRLFGLPSDDRDWQAMFDGCTAGKGDIRQAEERYEAACSVSRKSKEITSDNQTELISVMTHEEQRVDLDAAYGYDVVVNEEGMSGVVDKYGNQILPCVYDKVELKADGFAKLFSRKRIDVERPWVDLCNGVRFVREPKIMRYGFLTLSTTDGSRLYPRVKTKRMDWNSFVTLDVLKGGLTGGLHFHSFYIPHVQPCQLYLYKEKLDDVQLWEDENGGLVWKKDFETQLHPISQEEWNVRENAWKENIKKFNEDINKYTCYFKPNIDIDYTYSQTRHMLKDFQEVDIKMERKEDGNYQVYCREYAHTRWTFVGEFAKVFPQAYDIRVVKCTDGSYLVRSKMFEPLDNPEERYEYAELLDNVMLHIISHGKDYWVYLENRVCFSKKPEIVDIGFLKFLKVDDIYVEMSPYNHKKYRKSEIIMKDDSCFLGNNEILLKPTPRQWRNHYYIFRRYADGKHFILSDSPQNNEHNHFYDMYYDGKNPPVIKKKQRNI